MGLEKVIIKQIVKVAKDTGKLDTAISVMKDKLKEEGLKAIEKAGIDPSSLPFSPLELINGQIDNPESLLTPEIICSIPPLSNLQKEKAIRNVDSILISINTIIDNKNKLSSALQTVQTPLSTLSTTSQTLDTIITTVGAAIKVIKAIPIPVSVPPGAGIPLNVITILSDSLDQLDKLLVMGKGITSAILTLVKGVLDMINNTITKLNALDAIITPVITTISFVKIVAELGGQCDNLNNNIGSGNNGDLNNTADFQSAIDVISIAITTDIVESVATAGVNSNPALNAASEAELIAGLQPNAFIEGITFYKGFRLTLEYNPENTYSFDQRRIKAVRDFLSNPEQQFFRGGTKGNRTILSLVTIFNDMQVQGRYSYSSTVQVLYEEMKYQIDIYVLGLQGISIPRSLEATSRTSGGTNLLSAGNRGYVLSGNNTVTFTGKEVIGSITTTVSNVRVTLNTFGGISPTSSSPTNTILTITDPLQSLLSEQSSALPNSNVISPSLILTTPGIYTYRMVMVTNLDNGGQSNFSIEEPIVAISNNFTP